MNKQKFTATALALGALLLAGCGGSDDSVSDERDALEVELTDTQKALEKARADAKKALEKLRDDAKKDRGRRRRGAEGAGRRRDSSRDVRTATPSRGATPSGGRAQATATRSAGRASTATRQRGRGQARCSQDSSPEFHPVTVHPVSVTVTPKHRAAAGVTTVSHDNHNGHSGRDGPMVQDLTLGQKPDAH